MLEHSAQVQKVMKGEGISPDEMEKMISGAALTRARGFNRRFHCWLFKLQGNLVMEMEALEIPTMGKGEETMAEPCPACDGDRCRNCGWAGVVLRRIHQPAAPKYPVFCNQLQRTA